MEKYLEDVCLDLIVRKHVYITTVAVYSKQLITYGACGCENMYIVQYIWEGVQDEKKQEWQKSPVGTRQTAGKNLVWFGEIERKLAKLSKTTFTYRSSS